MREVSRRFRSFDGPVRLLVINQFTINLGFYMLMPYLANHLAGTLGLTAWLVGLVLGVRNLSQQGMFFVGGALADRFGYKPLIVAGCALRTAGFGLLAFTSSVPGLIIASAATGFAGALFNPAVRAYVALEAGERRVEAFALFNIFYQAGILIGPLIGLVLTGVTFRLTCVVAAVVFAVLTVLQLRALPAARQTAAPSASNWRSVLSNRSFLLFSLAMAGSYVLSFQTYLALPLEARRLADSSTEATIAVAAVFGVSGLVAIGGQLSVTDWCKRRWGPDRSLVTGVAVMAVSFLPPLISTFVSPQGVLAFAPLIGCAVILTLGTVVVFPFEMDRVVAMSSDNLVATYYGVYNTICGVGITAGNLLTGTAIDAARAQGVPALPWLILIVLGLGAAAAVLVLGRSSHEIGRAEARRS